MRIFPLSIIISLLLTSFFTNGNENISDRELVELKVKYLCNALSMFKLDQYHWPTNEEGLYVLTFPSLNGYSESGEPYLNGDPYLNVIEKDPWGNDYVYSQTKKRFRLISIGRDGVFNTPDDIGPNICYPDWTEVLTSNTYEPISRQ